MTKNTVRQICVIAGILASSLSARAIPYDTQITIDRALNSPTLTIRYSGAFVALVESRINGESLGTRSVSAAKGSGETDFSFNVNDLKDGDNDVEIRLFDRTGKVVGTEHTNISTEQTLNAPVFLTTPKMGQTVMGPVSIKVGFGQKLNNVYVSFFVDNSFNSMSNFPPFEFTWDTARVSNGWHDIEAWAIDENSATLKTRRVKVFVNNPSGHTFRPGVTDTGTLSLNTEHVSITNGVSGLRGSIARTGIIAGASSRGLAPSVRTGAIPQVGDRTPTMGSAISAKPLMTPKGVATGFRSILPSVTMTKVATKGSNLSLSAIANQNRVSVSNPSPFRSVRATSANALSEFAMQSPKAPKYLGEISVKVHNPLVATRTPEGVGSSIQGLESATDLLVLTRGQRIPNLGAFAVVYNSQYVNFDVPTRVEDGIPLAPFRHLVEKSGGKIDWENMTKTVHAEASRNKIQLQIGSRDAKINNSIVTLEKVPTIDRGRTIVPLSFMHDALNVNVEYDKATGHVLITSIKK